MSPNGVSYHIIHKGLQHRVRDVLQTVVLAQPANHEEGLSAVVMQACVNRVDKH